MVIRAEIIFQVYEIIILTRYIKSVKSTELHMTRGLKCEGKEENLHLIEVVKQGFNK